MRFIGLENIKMYKTTRTISLGIKEISRSTNPQIVHVIFTDLSDFTVAGAFSMHGRQ